MKKITLFLFFVICVNLINIHVRAEEIGTDVETLKQLCENWSQKFGTRQITANLHDYYGKNVAKKIEFYSVPASQGGCTTNSEQASFIIARKSQNSNNPQEPILYYIIFRANIVQITKPDGTTVLGSRYVEDMLRSGPHQNCVTKGIESWIKYFTSLRIDTRDTTITNKLTELSQYNCNQEFSALLTELMSSLRPT
ncbi:MAG: hypothetical protein HQK52_21815 [Oligoflexia bacterium]|nr:hypothetical protein [Oligoflexia bacterium]